MGKFSEAATVASVPTQGQGLIEFDSRSSVEALSDAPILDSPAIGLDGLAGFLCFSTAITTQIYRSGAISSASGHPNLCREQAATQWLIKASAHT